MKTTYAYEYKDDTDREMLTATTLEAALIEAQAMLAESVRGNSDHLAPGRYRAEVIEIERGGEEIYHQIVVEV